MATPAGARLDPRIGMLNSGLFYCFPKGYAAPEFIGSRGEVETALGLSKPRVEQASTPGQPTLRTFNVEVTPSVVAHAGTWAGTAYVQQVVASTRAQAISKARAMRRESEGRYAPRATYRASLADPAGAAQASKHSF